MLDNVGGLDIVGLGVGSARGRASWIVVGMLRVGELVSVGCARGRASWILVHIVVGEALYIVGSSRFVELLDVKGCSVTIFFCVDASNIRVVEVF